MGGFDAIVLAGGAARRMGGHDKPMLEVAGRPMLVHVLDAVGGAGRRIVVGPRRDIGIEVIWCREEPPGGGPVAAIGAALPHVDADTVLVLAADLPWIAPAVEPLLGALDDPAVDVAMLTSDGRANYLAAAWRTRALSDAIGRAATKSTAATAGVSMRALVAGVPDALVNLVDDPAHWGDDYDTLADLARARTEGTHL